jgi:glycosyltransferase involved in cell wall biosynthesis
VRAFGELRQRGTGGTARAVTTGRGNCGKGWLNVSGTGEQLDEVLFARAQTTRGRPTNPKVTVVIPTLNEAENLPWVLSRLDPGLHELILVDGDSVDDTVEVARQLRPELRTLAQSHHGKGDALCTGFRAATGDIIVMLDADGSADPAEIPAFVGALRAGADFAKGSRFLQGAGTSDMPFYRKLGNFSFVMLVRALFGGRYSDLCYGYNAFWTDVLPRLRLESNGFEIETMMNIRALRARLRIVEVASFENRRIYGTSKLRTIPDGWLVLKAIIKERLTPLPAASRAENRPELRPAPERAEVGSDLK